jgi:hypothetical protein
MHIRQANPDPVLAQAPQKGRGSLTTFQPEGGQTDQIGVCSPDHRDAIGPELGILADDVPPMMLGLGNQQSVNGKTNQAVVH